MAAGGRARGACRRPARPRRPRLERIAANTPRASRRSPSMEGGADHDGRAGDDCDRADVDLHRPRARATRRARLPHGRRRRGVERAALDDARYQRAPDPFDVQRHTAFLGREVPVVTKSEFRNSGFTQAHLRGAKFIGWSTVCGARRARGAARRVGRAVRLRVLPRRRHRRARVRPRTTVSTSASSRSPTDSSATCSQCCRADAALARHRRPRPGPHSKRDDWIGLDATAAISST